MSTAAVTLFLCGDVMLGRGVDQILPHPGDPTLREGYVRDARDYVGLAESVNGPVPRPAGYRWPWGEVLHQLDAAAPDARVVNLETSVTRAGDFASGKGVHYRMSPANLPCLAAVRPDVCALANNHVLDFGRRGLQETLDVLADAGLGTAGAGRDADAARRPALVPLPSGGRLLVFSLGLPTSGIPYSWAATRTRAGVDLAVHPQAYAAALAERLGEVKRPGDIVVASVHWGGNWDYEVSAADTRFAHALVDAGVDVVHGHSSHHPRPLEVYRDRLVLYGCGDLVDDYEGIGGHEQYRDDLRLLYLVSVQPDTGRLAGVRMVPLKAHRMRLRHTSPADTAWLRAVVDGVSREFGCRIDPAPGGALALRWPGTAPGA
ncbi:putative polyglutamine synthesis accessory protein [Streptomyces sulfonofaciens]|uniref:Polyglutamine synthesis accessory protein n=1 Tax=Streptomyces sulfonofaciens TaxID=68272 RepID=A0A919G3Y3_9ACTN|nr:CapA family protein [Streptomyces sulfonofaciens]GHH77056.1 putative polyglutamine synthesis accessory protein [Streptomyces sulfonofaciens]